MRLEEEPLLSIIVPAYNEAENIPRLLERVHRALQGINYEIVIVDDGSFDGTSEAALASARSLGAPLVLIRLERNRGKIEALRTGIERARGRYLAFLDADLEYPPEALPKMLRLAMGGAELVIGFRRDRRPLRRRLISSGARVLAKIMIPEVRRLRDPVSEYILANKDLLNRMPLRNYIKPYLPLVIGAKKVAEIEVNVVPRDTGSSSFKPKWILQYIWELGALSNWFTARYLVGALIALPISLILYPYIGLLAPFLASLAKWALIWKEITPAGVMLAKAAALALKLLADLAWPLTALLELIAIHLMRRIL
jgi:dolichol-phosphate mannosyltransferase